MMRIRRRVAGAVLLGVALGAQGCGTLASEELRPFGGVALDLGLIAQGSQRFLGPVLAIAAAIDLPFSLAADVALLPIVGLVQLVQLVQPDRGHPTPLQPAPPPLSLPVEIAVERGVLVVLGEVADHLAPDNPALRHERRCYTEQHRARAREAVARWLEDTAWRAWQRQESPVEPGPLVSGARLVAAGPVAFRCPTLGTREARRELYRLTHELAALPADRPGEPWPAIEGHEGEVDEVVYVVLLPDAAAVEGALDLLLGSWPPSRTTIVPTPMGRAWTARDVHAQRAAAGRRGVRIAFLDADVEARHPGEGQSP